MVIIISLLFLLFLLPGIFWHQYFKRRENLLLDTLQNMADQAMEGRKEGTLAGIGISETKLSRLENSIRRCLDDSMAGKKMQEQQKKAIQGLISDIAHQTLTPVSNLKLYTQLLAEAQSLDTTVMQQEETAGIIGTICEQTEKLDFLIQSLVKLSRMENGIISTRPQVSGVQGLLYKLVLEYKGKAQEKNITLELKEMDMPVTACFDEKWTREALGNITDNAIKYTPAGGCITISVQEYSFFARIDIADNGPGIDEAEIPKIFSRFYRGYTAAEKPGTGIGLYIAKEIITAQNGYIKAVSGKEKGTVFSVFLPVQDRQKTM